MDLLTFDLPPFPTFIKGGEATFSKGKKHIKRTFQIFDLLYVKKGTIFLVEDQQKYTVQEGQYIILAPFKEHAGSRPCLEETHYDWLHFQLEQEYQIVPDEPIEWSKIMREDGNFIQPPRYRFMLPRYGTLRQRDGIESLLSRLMALNEKYAPEAKLKQQMVFEELILQLQKDTIHIPTAAEQVTEKVMAYIHQHYMENIRMQQMGKDLLYHPDYLTRCTQQTIGMTPIQYLNHYRLSLSKHDLATTSDNMSAIAKRVGVTDPTYFSKLFKKIEGMSPNEYRRIVRRRS